VWGDNIYVYGPFSVQGFLYTSIAGSVSLILFLYILWNVPFSLFTDSGLILEFLKTNQQYFALELVGLAFIGLLSWFLSSTRFIRQSSSNLS
jgi:cell division protein FtsX